MFPDIKAKHYILTVPEKYFLSKVKVSVYFHFLYFKLVTKTITKGQIKNERFSRLPNKILIKVDEKKIAKHPTCGYSVIIFRKVICIKKESGKFD